MFKNKLLLLAVLAISAVFVWADAPANDNVANAQAFTIGDTVNGTTTDATLENGESDAIGQGWVNSVWYKFNLGTTYQQKVTINVTQTEGSAEDACLVVATGTGWGDFQIITAQDTSVDETYNGNLDGDKDYYFGVYGWNADCCGDFVITSSSLPIKDWYAAPGATGSGDSFDDPCDLKTALESVATGNSVFLAPGTYSLAEVGTEANFRWMDGVWLLCSTPGINIVGSGSDQTVILCDGDNDVGVALSGNGINLKGVTINHPKDIKGNDSWGGAYYGLAGALTLADCGNNNLEDVVVYVGAEGEMENCDSGYLIRPVTIQPSLGTTVNVKDCAFISEGLLTSCNVRPMGSDASANVTTINFDCVTLRSNYDVIHDMRAITVFDHNCAIYGNTWWTGNSPLTVNVRNCIFLNTGIPCGEQAGGEDVVWNFNVSKCFMPGANLEQTTHANTTYTDCDNVMDPQVDRNWCSSLVKAGKGCVIPYAEYVTVVDEDFSSYDEGSLIGNYGWSNGYGNDGSGTVVKDGGNTYVTITSGSGLWGAHYNFDNPVASGWCDGSANKYRLWVYSARLKYSGSNANPWFGFWTPQLYESQFKKDGDHYLFSPDGTTWSSLEIPVDEWFDFEIGVDPTAVNKRHNTLYVKVNGVSETLNVVGGQENDSDIFGTFRYFFWGGGLTVSIDSFKLVYMCDGPVNDYLKNAKEFTGAAIGDNEYARVESGESTDNRYSVWYYFQATNDKKLNLFTTGTWDEFANDTMLGVYSASTATPTFADLTVVVPLTDTGRDESVSFEQEVGKYYFIVVGSYEGAGGFILGSKYVPKDNVYVAPGATGDGCSPETPMGSISEAMELVTSGNSVILAPGEYSIADNYNQTDVWGAGMTVLCFKVENVTLKGAGPDKTTIVVPPGYVGIRMERKGASVRDLTVKAYRTDNMVYHYNWHMQGAICACNQPGMSVSNVAIYSEQKSNEIRPFAIYSVKTFKADRVAIEAPECCSPLFINASTNVSVNFLTTYGCKLNNNPGIYCGNWPWGNPKNEGVTFRNILVANAYMPFTVEADEEIFIYDSVYYDCPNQSNFADSADVVEEGCQSFMEGENDPKFETYEGYILTATEKINIYKNVGWHTVPEPAFFGLLALAALFLRRK